MLLVAVAMAAGLAFMPSTLSFGGVVPANRPTGTPHTSPAPLTSGYVKSSALGVYRDLGGVPSGTLINPGNLQITMPDPNPTVNDSFVVTAPTGGSLTVGATYSGNPSSSAGGFSYQGWLGACTSGNPGSWVHIDQLATDGSGHLTSFAVQFVCDGVPWGSSPPGWYWGSFASNVVPTTPHQGYYLFQGAGPLT